MIRRILGLLLNPGVHLVAFACAVALFARPLCDRLYELQGAYH